MEIGPHDTEHLASLRNRREFMQQHLHRCDAPCPRCSLTMVRR